MIPNNNYNRCKTVVIIRLQLIRTRSALPLIKASINSIAVDQMRRVMVQITRRRCSLHSPVTVRNPRVGETPQSATGITSRQRRRIHTTSPVRILVKGFNRLNNLRWPVTIINSSDSNSNSNLSHSRSTLTNSVNLCARYQQEAASLKCKLAEISHTFWNSFEYQQIIWPTNRH